MKKYFQIISILLCLCIGGIYFLSKNKESYYLSDINIHDLFVEVRDYNLNEMKMDALNYYVSMGPFSKSFNEEDVIELELELPQEFISTIGGENTIIAELPNKVDKNTDFCLSTYVRDPINFEKMKNSYHIKINLYVNHNLVNSAYSQLIINKTKD